VKLIACARCHAQYDVASMGARDRFDCRCGETLEVQAAQGLDARAHDAVVQRCGACGALARDSQDACDYCGSAILPPADRGSLICPECYARNADDARFCLACGVAFDPQPLPSSAAPELRCPCCERWMARRLVAGLELQECPGCFGLWAPEDRFDTLVDRAVQAARQGNGPDGSPPPRVDGGNPARVAVEYRRCPRCDSVMARRNFQRRSGVIIDRCRAHGSWLDAHELERIAGFVLSGRAARAERLEAEAASRRAREAHRAGLRRTIQIGSDRTITGMGVPTGSDRSPVRTIFDLLNTLLT